MDHQRRTGHRGEATADQKLERRLAMVVQRGDEADVVDGGVGAVGRRGGDGDLELARQALSPGIAQEKPHHGLQVRRGVKQLVLGQAGPRVLGDVAHGAAAGFGHGQPGFRQKSHGLFHIRQRKAVDLDVLSGGDVAQAARTLLDDFRDGAQLLGQDNPAGHLDAQHVDVGLALAVDAAGQAVGAVGVRRQAPSGIILGAGDKLVDIAQLAVVVVKRCGALVEIEVGVEVHGAPKGQCCGPGAQGPARISVIYTGAIDK